MYLKASLMVDFLQLLMGMIFRSTIIHKKILLILNHFLYKISLKYILQTKIYMVSSVSILMSIISPEVRAKDVSLCFTIYQFNTSSSSHLASTILVRYDIMYPTNIFICFVRFRLTPRVLGCNKLMPNTTYKLNSHNQQNHHLISYMFSLSLFHYYKKIILMSEKIASCIFVVIHGRCTP